MENMIAFINSFTVFGLEIKFYGVIMAISYLVAFILCLYFCKKKGYDENLPYVLILIAFPLAVIGGRLGYVIFSGRSWSFLEILNIRTGGLMLFGGVILALIGICVYALIKKKNPLVLLDLIAPCLVLGQAIGRWGNFFNQEAYGYAVNNPSLQWFPLSVFIEADASWHLATFFYESIWCLLVFFILYFVYRKTNRVGLTASLYLVLYGIERYFVEGLRTDSLYIGNYRISQIISIIMIILGVAYLIYLTFVAIKENEIKKAKYKEMHIYEDEAKELKAEEYTAPTYEYEVQAKKEKAEKEKAEKAKEPKETGNKRVLKAIEERQKKKELKEKQDRKKRKRQ